MSQYQKNHFVDTPATQIKPDDLPAFCPIDNDPLWSSHPKVYLPLKKLGDQTSCPYCGRIFELADPTEE